MDRVLAEVVPYGDDQCRSDYTKLESAIKDVMERTLKDENAKMADPDNTAVPTFVVATKYGHQEAPPTLFRSYEYPGHSKDECGSNVFHADYHSYLVRVRT